MTQFLTLKSISKLFFHHRDQILMLVKFSEIQICLQLKNDVVYRVLRHDRKIQNFDVFKNWFKKYCLCIHKAVCQGKHIHFAKTVLF